MDHHRATQTFHNIHNTQAFLHINNFTGKTWVTKAQ
jgi:hypothetical protein